MAPLEPNDVVPLDPNDMVPLEPKDAAPLEPNDPEPLEPRDCFAMTGKIKSDCVEPVKEVSEDLLVLLVKELPSAVAVKEKSRG